MFKKIILSLILAVTPFVFSSAFAIQFTAVSETQFNQSANDTPFWRLIIIADEWDEINVEHGIGFVLPKGEAIQWDRTKAGIQVSGTAANKVILDPKISDDLNVVHFDVQDNFAKGDELYIDGLTPRTFRKAVSSRPLGLDLNNNGIRDIDNFYPFSVKDVERSDFIAPYSPEEFRAEYLENPKRIKLMWKNPKDYDLWQVAITRTRTVGGKVETLDVYSGHEETYVDNDARDGEVKYIMHAIDQEGNNSGAVDVVVMVGNPPPEDPHVPTPTPTPTPPVTTDQEKENALLTKLFDYYYIRYQIKCLATGADVESSLCLSTKTDLVYAQEKLGKIKALSAVITERDKYLMKLRLKWPEKRYNDECVKKSTKANFCPALDDSINRQKYFINKK